MSDPEWLDEDKKRTRWLDAPHAGPGEDDTAEDHEIWELANALKRAHAHIDELREALRQVLDEAEKADYYQDGEVFGKAEHIFDRDEPPEVKA